MQRELLKLLQARATASDHGQMLCHDVTVSRPALQLLFRDATVIRGFLTAMRFRQKFSGEESPDCRNLRGEETPEPMLVQKTSPRSRRIRRLASAAKSDDGKRVSNCS